MQLITKILSLHNISIKHHAHFQDTTSFNRAFKSKF